MTTISPITTHVLDTALGRPAAGIAVELETHNETAQWDCIATGETDDDGRIMDLLAPGSLQTGRYRLTFATGDYFRQHAIEGFYPVVQIEFEIRESDQHYHVPLLLSPFGYSTYRGS